MKIHSLTLTPTDLLNCVPDGCYLAVFDHPGFGRTRVGKNSSRTIKGGTRYTVRLSGSNKRPMRNLDDPSATWDEWGNFIAAVYERDPEAHVDWYGSRENFMRITREEYERIRDYRSDLAPTHRAPWLDREYASVI